MMPGQRDGTSGQGEEGRQGPRLCSLPGPSHIWPVGFSLYFAVRQREPEVRRGALDEHGRARPDHALASQVVWRLTWPMQHDEMQGSRWVAGSYLREVSYPARLPGWGKGGMATSWRRQHHTPRAEKHCCPHVTYHRSIASALRVFWGMSEESAKLTDRGQLRSL